MLLSRRTVLAPPIVGAILLLACSTPSAQPAGPAPSAAAAQPTVETSAAPPAPLQRVVVMVANTSAVFLPHKLAETQGFFRAHGLEGEVIVTNSSVQAAAVASGEADFSGQLPAAIRYKLAGMPMTAFAAIVGHSTRRLVAQPQYRTVAELKGKVVVGSSPSGSDTVILRRMLRFYGLEPDQDVSILNAGDVPARWAALQSGQADAALFAGGEWIQAQELGFPILANAADVLDMPENGLAAADRKLAEQPEQVKATLRAMLDTMAFIERDPAGAARGMAEWTGIAEPQALLHVEALLPSLARDLLPTDEGLRAVIEAERAGAGITQEVTPDEVTNFTLLREVLRERGATIR
jgi:ABC-type nitrate/sulfonate/bicarbonate transport system substrate-binding protein